MWGFSGSWVILIILICLLSLNNVAITKTFCWVAVTSVLYRKMANLCLKRAKFTTAQGKANQKLSKGTCRASVLNCSRENSSKARTLSDQGGGSQVCSHSSCCSCTHWWVQEALDNGELQEAGQRSWKSTRTPHQDNFANKPSAWSPQSGILQYPGNNHII